MHILINSKSNFQSAMFYIAIPRLQSNTHPPHEGAIRHPARNTLQARLSSNATLCTMIACNTWEAGTERDVRTRTRKKDARGRRRRRRCGCEDENPCLYPSRAMYLFTYRSY